MTIAFIAVCCIKLLDIVQAAPFDRADLLSRYSLPVNASADGRDGLDVYAAWIELLTASNKTFLVTSPFIIGLPVITAVAVGISEQTTLCQERDSFYRDVAWQSFDGAGYMSRPIFCGNGTDLTNAGLSLAEATRPLEFLGWPEMLRPTSSIRGGQYFLSVSNFTELRSRLGQGTEYSLVAAFEDPSGLLVVVVTRISLFPFPLLDHDVRGMGLGGNVDLSMAVLVLGVLDVVAAFFTLFRRPLLQASIVGVDLVLLLSAGCEVYLHACEAPVDLSTKISFVELSSFAETITEWTVPTLFVRLLFMPSLLPSIPNLSSFLFLFTLTFLSIAAIGSLSLGDTGLPGELSSLSDFLWVQWLMLASQWPEFAFWDFARHTRPVAFSVWQFLNGVLVFCVLFNFFQAMVKGVAEEERMESVAGCEPGAVEKFHQTSHRLRFVRTELEREIGRLESVRMKSKKIHAQLSFPITDGEELARQIEQQQREVGRVTELVRGEALHLDRLLHPEALGLSDEAVKAIVQASVREHTR